MEAESLPIIFEGNRGKREGIELVLDDSPEACCMGLVQAGMHSPELFERGIRWVNDTREPGFKAEVYETAAEFLFQPLDPDSPGYQRAYQAHYRFRRADFESSGFSLRPLSPNETTIRASALAMMFSLRNTPEQVTERDPNRDKIRECLAKIGELHGKNFTQREGVHFLVRELMIVADDEDSPFGDVGQDYAGAILGLLGDQELASSAQELTVIIAECIEEYRTQSRCFVDPRTFIHQKLGELLGGNVSSQRLAEIMGNESLRSEYRQACLERLKINLTGINRLEPDVNIYHLWPALAEVLKYDSLRAVDIGSGVLPLVMGQIIAALPNKLKHEEIRAFLKTFDYLPSDPQILAEIIELWENHLVQNSRYPSRQEYRFKDPSGCLTLGNLRIRSKFSAESGLNEGEWGQLTSELRAAQFSLKDYDRVAGWMRPDQAINHWLHLRDQLFQRGIEVEHHSGAPFHELVGSLNLPLVNFIHSSRGPLMHSPDEGTILTTLQAALKIAGPDCLLYLQHGLAERFGHYADLLFLQRFRGKLVTIGQADITTGFKTHWNEELEEARARRIHSRTLGI